MKVKMFVARYICYYYDQMPLSSTEIYANDKKKLIKQLKSEGYDKSEIDIDTTYGQQEGWQIEEIEIEI